WDVGPQESDGPNGCVVGKQHVTMSGNTFAELGGSLGAEEFAAFKGNIALVKVVRANVGNAIWLELVAAWIQLAVIAIEMPNDDLLVDEVADRLDAPLVRDDAHVRLLVAGLHFHNAPIFLRWPSTRAASVATSSVSSGNGVA